MGHVRKSPYRQPVTPEGLKKIEEGTLQWFDDEVFANFNTEVLEEYLEETNRREGFTISNWSWKKIGLTIFLGTLFAIINQYIGLKIGLIVSGSWYVAYLIGMSLRWSPSETNIATSASTGAAMICTGFVFTFPAIYLLALSPAYAVNGEPLISEAALNNANLVPIGIVATILAGFLGVLYFIIFRRVWLVEDPLPLPTFESYVKLLDITNDISMGSVAAARKSLKTVVLWTLGTMAFVFLIGFRVFGKEGRENIADMGAKNVPVVRDIYSDGVIHQPYGTTVSPFNYTFLSLGLSPSLFAVGWFMKGRTALLVNAGSLLAWFVIIPMAILLDMPVFSPNDQVWIFLSSSLYVGPGYDNRNLVAFASIVRIIAIGCILGGGITGLIKMAPIFKSATEDIFKATASTEEDSGTGAYVQGRGWYEWPPMHILSMGIITSVGIFLVFVIGGFPIVASIVFVLVLISTTFLLGAIAVRVMGETGIEPVSGTSFIVLLMLVGVFTLLGLEQDQLVIMSLLGTTVFAGAISMSGDVITDFKNGLYTGNRPYHIMKAEMTGIVPGAIVSAIFAVLLSRLLATGELSLEAPQANAFAYLMTVLVGGNIPWLLLILGLALGVFIELTLSMGTAFGLGMYLPLFITMPYLIGGFARDGWEKRVLEPWLAANEYGEKEKTLRLLNSYMICTGFIVGEGLIFTVLAVTLAVQGLGGA